MEGYCYFIAVHANASLAPPEASRKYDGTVVPVEVYGVSHNDIELLLKASFHGGVVQRSVHLAGRVKRPRGPLSCPRWTCRWPLSAREL